MPATAEPNVTVMTRVPAATFGRTNTLVLALPEPPSAVTAAAGHALLPSSVIEETETSLG